jgi:hypothetical protein
MIKRIILLYILDLSRQKNQKPRGDFEAQNTSTTFLMPTFTSSLHLFAVLSLYYYIYFPFPGKKTKNLGVILKLRIPPQHSSCPLRG